MFITLLLKGILIGYLGSTPLGPISVLIIQRTIAQGRRQGFYSGIGAALSDSTYVAIAAFSLSIIIAFIRKHELLFTIFGAAILVLLGLYIFFSAPHPGLSGKNNHPAKLVNLVFSTYLLTITNPLIIFPYLGIFASTGVLKNIATVWQPLFLLAGFLTGACGWWFTLTSVVNLLHGRFNFKNLLIFNKIAGIAILLFVVITLILTWFKPGS